MGEWCYDYLDRSFACLMNDGGNSTQDCEILCEMTKRNSRINALL